MFGRDRIIRSHLVQRFVVTLKTGTAFEGLLVDADARLLVLADAQVHLDAGAQPVDGKLFLERADVAYMQLAATPPVLTGVVVP